MKELIKPSLTEEEYEEKNVAGYCDNASCSSRDCNQDGGEDEFGDILF